MNRAEFEDERETLKRIAATLLGLAVLAEFLCLVPLWLRASVLTLLRSAEAVARAFAAGQAGGALALPPAAVPGPNGDGCDEAMRLARCFRALASVIGGGQELGAGALFSGALNGRLAQRAPAIGSRGHLMKMRRVPAVRGAAHIDTS